MMRRIVILAVVALFTVAASAEPKQIKPTFPVLIGYSHGLTLAAGIAAPVNKNFKLGGSVLYTRHNGDSSTTVPAFATWPGDCLPTWQAVAAPTSPKGYMGIAITFEFGGK